MMGQTTGLDCKLLQASVVSVDTNARCTIRLADQNATAVTPGSSTNGWNRIETGSSSLDNISGVKFLASASFSAGDTVWVLRTGDALIVIGKVSVVSGELQIDGAARLRVTSGNADGSVELGNWASGSGYSYLGSATRRVANNQHYILLWSGTGGDGTTYMSSGGGGVTWRKENNGDDIAHLDHGTVRFSLKGTDRFGSSDCHRFYDDGEAWHWSVGIGGDNPNNDGLHMSVGNINMRGRTIYLGATNNDAGQASLAYAMPSFDGPKLTGWQYVELRRANGSWTCQFGVDGLYTNLGWGLSTAGVLNSGLFGGGTGGTLQSKSGGNVIRFDWDGTFRMWVDVTNVKNFVIDHPLDQDRHLIHACLEGPEAAVFYRGQGQLDNGWCQVDLPDYFEALCAVEGRSVQLTCIADDPADEWCPVLHATYPKSGKFYVGLGSGVVVNDQRFWWEVTAVRKDVAPVNVTPLKEDVVVMGNGPYTYYREK